MLQKHLRLVGLVAVLALVGLVGSTVAWAAQVPQPVTLDPGQTTTSSAVRDGLLAEALPLIAKAGYNPQEFNFEKAVADPEGKALFLPVRVANLEKLPAFIGLLYVREPLQLTSKAVKPGLYPIRVNDGAVLSGNAVIGSTEITVTRQPAPIRSFQPFGCWNIHAKVWFNFGFWGGEVDGGYNSCAGTQISGGPGNPGVD